MRALRQNGTPEMTVGQAGSSNLVGGFSRRTAAGGTGKNAGPGKHWADAGGRAGESDSTHRLSGTRGDSFERGCELHEEENVLQRG